MFSLAPPDVATELRATTLAVLAVVVLFSVVLALLFRRRYVAAVVRLQGRTQMAPKGEPASAGSVPALRVKIEALADDAGSDAGASVLRLRRKLLTSKVVSDVVFWCGFVVLCLAGVMLATTVLYAIRTGDTSMIRMAFRLLSLGVDSNFSLVPVWVNVLWGLMWLVVPPVIVSATHTALPRWQIYLPILLVVAVWIAETVHASSFGGPIAVVVGIAVVGGVVLLLHDPRVRGAASPLILALSISLTAWMIIPIGILLYFQGVNGDDTSFSASDALGLAAWLVLVAVTAAGVLFLLARDYQRKRFSDIQLADVAFWVLTAVAAFGAVGTVATGVDSLHRLVALAAALMVWTVIVTLVRRRWRRRVLRSTPPVAGGLLILRVFKRAAQSEVFIDRLLSLWRFAGPVDFIAGPDLAGASIEPDEFFMFMRRRLADRFVRTTAEIDSAIDRLDRARDPDGRFRVNELFCVEDTWREMVGRLMGQASVVLLDLREYTPSRAGTRYEIYQLMNVVPVERIVVLMGRQEDADAIAEELSRAWAAMSDTSRNRGALTPELQVCRLQSGSAAEVRRLFLRTHAVATRVLEQHLAAWVAPSASRM
jgi:hypothetical protein